MARYGGQILPGMLHRWYCSQCGYAAQVRGKVPGSVILSLNDVYGTYDFHGGTVPARMIPDPQCVVCGAVVVFVELSCTDHQFMDWFDTRESQIWAVRFCKLCHFEERRVPVDAASILNGARGG